MMTLFLGRHGETRLNSEQRLRSWIDEPLNKEGVKQAEAMGVAMKKYPIDRVYCSDLDRADHTAHIIAKQHKLLQIPRQWFRPLDYGTLNGKKISEIESQLEALNKIWQTDPDHEAPSGESFKEFQDRNLQGLHAILKNASYNEQILLVAHLRNCLLFHAVAINGHPLKGPEVQVMDGKSWHQDPGSVSKFIWDGNLLKFVGIIFSIEGESQQKAGVS